MPLSEGAQDPVTGDESANVAPSVETIKAEILPLLRDLRFSCSADYREEDKPKFSKEGMLSKYRLEWFTNVFDLISLCLPRVKEPLQSVLRFYVDNAITEIRASWRQPRTLEEVRNADQMLEQLITHVETEM